MPGPRVVILNPFDPLCGEEQAEGRYAYLARRLAERGMAVTWISSDWSHRHKRRRDVAALCGRAETVGVGLELVKTPPYDRNVGLRRLRSHRAFVKAAVTVLETLSPRVVIVSTPPPALAERAVAAAHRLGAAAVVDVQDLWPKEFERVAPRGAKWLTRAAFAGMQKAYRRACRDADARVGVAEVYLADAQRFGKGERDLMVHLGVDIETFDRDARSGRDLCALENRAPRRVLFWGGTIGSGQDWRTVVEAVARLGDTMPDAVLAVLGTGPAAEAMRDLCCRRTLGDRARFLGWQPHDAYAATLSASAVALNAWELDSTVAFPNRAFDFLAAGVPVVNSLGGEFGRLVEAERVGLNYPAGDADALADAVGRLLADDATREGMGRRARRLAEQRFDRKVEYEPYLQLCETMAGQGGRTPGDS